MKAPNFDQPVGVRRARTADTNEAGTMFRVDGTNAAVVFGCDSTSFDRLNETGEISIVPMDSYANVEDAFRDGWMVIA